jgi:spermidine synthase
MARGVMAALWLCFTVSGAAALALEMLWLRSAGLIVGQTAATAATVLAWYFAGLSVGALAGRDVGARPVRTYGWLELGAGGGVLWSLLVLRTAGGAAGQRWLAATEPVGGVVVMAAAMLPAALCLGATLPAVGRAVEGGGSAGPRAGLLYALNTLGGAFGIAAAGFGLPALIGVGASYAVVAAANAAIGAVALLVDRRRAAQSAPAAGDPRPAAAARRRLRAVAAGAGALGLGLEVVWTRLFAQVLHNSVYSFAAVVLVYVLALAAGAALGARALGRRSSPTAVAGGALVGAALTTVGGVWAFIFLTDGLAYVGMRAGLGEYLLRIVGLAALTAGPAALASGAVLPALWAAWGGDVSAARPLGDLSAANTAGGIAGVLATGFIVLPNLGVRGALLAAAVSYVVLADVVAPRRGRARPLGYAVLVLIAVGDPLRAPLVNLRAGETLRAVAEGASGTVSVVEASDDLQMRLDNFYVLGGSAAATGERRLGLVPLLLHADPHRALFVGMATGISASAGPALGLDDTTVVELVPEVVEAARAHFGPWNGGLLARRDVRLIVDDGRRYLTATDERFDVIVSDLFIPWHAGAGSLYAREMYAAAAAHLADDGLFCQWLPLYQLTREEFALIARTFATVFPVTTLWRADFYPDRPVVGLVGQLLPRRLDLARVGERLERLPAWSRDPLLASPRGLALLYAGDLGAATDLIAGETINTDDRPLLEFTAPRLTRMNAAGDKDWFAGDALAAFLDALAARSAAVPDPLFARSDAVTAARRAGGVLYRYALAKRSKDERAADALAAEVRRLVPDVVASAESSDAVGALADARRTLADLRSEQEQVRAQLDAMQHRLGELTEVGRGDP